jgi:hypothetical protein
LEADRFYFAIKIFIDLGHFALLYVWPRILARERTQGTEAIISGQEITRLRWLVLFSDWCYSAASSGFWLIDPKVTLAFLGLGAFDGVY